MAFSTVKNREDYDGNGATTSFPLRFPFQLEEDIVALITNELVTPNVEYPLTLDVDYSLSGAGESSGTLTFPISGSAYPILPDGWSLTARRAPELTQETDFQEGDGLPAEDLEASVDRAMMACGMLDEKINRCLSLPESYAGVSIAVPKPVSKATLVWNAAGTAIENGPTADQIVNAEGAAVAAQEAQAASESARDEAVAAHDTAVSDSVEAAIDAVQPYVASASASATTATTQAGIATAQATAAAGAVSAVAALAFSKTDPATVAFTKTAVGAASIKAGTKVGVGSTVVTFATATAITMPTLTAGTDYAVWVKDDGTIQATADFASAPGAGNWRKIGGFHYSPGGHSGASGGGNATPQINEYSFWDLKFRPACPDPRGMALVADGFWADIYGLGVDHLTNGTSKYNVTLADGSTPPKIPTKFGGNGSTAYGSLTWFEASEVMRSHGKRLPRYTEFAALAFGTTENSAIGTDPVSSSWSAAYASKWGLAQVSGCMWWWGDEFGTNADVTTAWGWYDQAGARGQIYERGLGYLTAVIFGGGWANAAICGSRCSYWSASPSASLANFGARGVCDHLALD